ncbi:MAG: heat-inducible transcription repressor HrcA [Dehalococcoidaceae bacterium]|nr:heat-inducible transcription repressor HrcA [Dehalococcoidaceae bacterium]
MLLTQRKNTLLGMVIENYINTASPVSSNTLSKSNELSVSPATIRNDLATLEHEGYLTHMHTSSGRIPCDLGYRHYVNAIMNEEKLSFKEQLTIEHQMFQVQGNIDSRLAITASTLSSIIGNVVLITKKQERANLNDIKIFDVLPERLLVLVVFNDGTVEKRLVDKNRSSLIKNAPDILFLTNQVKKIFNNKKFISEFEQDYLIDSIKSIVEGEKSVINHEIFLEGLPSLIAQPEFSTKESMLSIYENLDYIKYNSILIEDNLSEQIVSVSIGDEIPINSFDNLSIVSANYSLREATTGSIMVIGPKRMRYGKVIPLVRYVSELLSY